MVSVLSSFLVLGVAVCVLFTIPFVSNFIRLEDRNTESNFDQVMSTAEHIVPRNVPYFALGVAEAFKELTPTQRLYAHHLAWAGWHGTRPCAEQLSYESGPLLQLFFALFSHNSVAELKVSAAAAGVTDDDFQMFLEYFALFYSNMGNYLSFGDSKIVPAVGRESFEKIFTTAPNGADAIAALFTSQIVDKVYSLSAGEKTLTFNCTAYYGPNVTEEDVTIVDEWVTANMVSAAAVNTRINKRADGTLELKIAAAEEREEKPFEFKGRTIVVSYGDFAPFMARVASSIAEAKKYAANADQEAMCEAYVKHFTAGHVEDHKESQRHWVKDKGPAVETNIGFIENYRDPAGVRAEWEGFVAVVNKKQSEKYSNMVGSAPAFIASLPWGKDFEKEVFTKPDFTSLEVLSFASSGIPIGICIPNYDDVRSESGFKNVYLANVVAAMSFKEKMNHYTDDDWELFKEKIGAAFPVGVGVHELLGHGTGKLLAEDEKGTLNFDKAAVINPIDGKPVATWYKPGETWSSVFKAISNPYEECRAEAVALYLCLESDLLHIFGETTAADQDKTIHLVWLQMVRAGMVGLEFYSAEKSQWLQAHMRARFAILQTLLRAPNPIVHITHDGDNLTITIDADRIKTDGKKAIGDLLTHLNVFKATADQARGTQYFEDLTAVNDTFLAMRATVMKMKKPRRQIVQPHTRLTANGEDVELVEFEPSVEGVVDSFVTRHKDIPL